MVLAHIVSGIAAGGLAGLTWLVMGGGWIGAFGSYTIAGQIAALALLVQSARTLHTSAE